MIFDPPRQRHRRTIFAYLIDPNGETATVAIPRKSCTKAESAARMLTSAQRRENQTVRRKSNPPAERVEAVKRAIRMLARQALAEGLIRAAGAA